MTRTHSPSSALMASILLMALSFGSGCAPDGTPPSLEWQSPTPQGALRGELAVYSANMYNGTTDFQYALRVDGNPRDERPLRFQDAPNLPSGVWLDVWGHEESGQWVVSRYEKTPGQNLEPTRQALIGAPPLKTRSIAFVLVDLGAGVNMTSEAALKRLVGTSPGDDSVRQFFTEASFGRLDVTAKVFGPLKTTISGCSVNGIPTDLRPQIPGTFDQYFWYLGKQVTSCGWSGLAMVGSPDRPARDTWFNGSSGCTVLVHEPGHNLGLLHASSMACGTTNAFVDEPNGTCTHSEYGDTTDAMGSSCRHMNVYTKTYQEWFGRCNLVDVTSSGTFNLLPIELPCDGIQGLQIAMPKTRPFLRSGGGGRTGTTNLTHYYIELRTPIGFDARHGNTSAMIPQVQIRVSGDIRQRKQSGYNTWILDMLPSTKTLDGLGAGGTFKDPAGGITFTVEAISATGATVRVEMPNGTGAPTCMDGTTLTLPGPGPESCAAGLSVPDATSTARDGGSLEPWTDGGPGTASGAEVRPPQLDSRDTRMPPAVMDATLGTGRDDSRGANADAGSANRADGREAIGGSSGAEGRAGTGGAGGTQTGEMGGTGGATGRQDADSQTYTILPSSGCSCRFPGTPGPNGPGVSLLVLALALGWAGRKRRR